MTLGRGAECPTYVGLFNTGLAPFSILAPLLAGATVSEQAPDYTPIIDRLESPEGFVVATVSAHGFGLCPASGQAIGELVTKGTSSIPIEGLTLGRFAGLAASWREARQWVAGAYNT